ncbi:hypothetical protein TrVFT333_010615 [Trichoderma virens FT-333]|nr:hypothetical protein TrVFT333_010615 [Trichoderma virens FT-333]
MHGYGFGSDQVLEFNVVLADDSKVLASPCSSPDLFQALRGGCPRTYGIVTSATVRTYLETPMGALVLQIIPQESNSGSFSWRCARLRGWAAWDGKSSLGPPSPMLQQAAGVFNQTLEQVQNTMIPTKERLTVFKSRGIDARVDYLTFPSYHAKHDYLNELMHHDAEVGRGILMSSRLYEEKHLTNATANTSALHDITGSGAAAKDFSLSGVNPAFRRALLINIVSRNWNGLTPYADIKAAQKDVAYHKGKAQLAFAPDTGSYLNEGNFLDPDYLTNQFGAVLPTLEAAKKKYDPTDLCYCPTCVCSQHWAEEADGHLCTV